MQQFVRHFVFISLLGTAISARVGEVLGADLKACLHDGTNIGDVSS